MPKTQPPVAPSPKPGIMEIHPYVPGKSSVEGIAHPIKLSANENILGSSEKAREAYVSASGQLHMYPDSRTTILRAAIAERYGLEPDRLIFGCGSDEIFHLLNDTFLEPGDNIVQGEYAFASFAIGAHKNQAQVKNAPEPDYRIDVDEILKAVDERTRLVFIANPANPTGTWIPFSEIQRLHENLRGDVVLVLDGAYAEFADDPTFSDGLDLARSANNVVVTHTFSKMHGLAALRVGWAYAPAEIAGAMDRIRLPFNTTVPAQLAAVEALKDTDFQRRSIEHVNRWRPWFEQQIGGLGLDTVRPSAANFVLVGFHKTGRTAAEAEAFLAARGLLVRGLKNYGMPDHIRITIGLEDHNRAVIEGLAQFMAS